MYSKGLTACTWVGGLVATNLAQSPTITCTLVGGELVCDPATAGVTNGTNVSFSSAQAHRHCHAYEVTRSHAAKVWGVLSKLSSCPQVEIRVAISELDDLSHMTYACTFNPRQVPLEVEY